MLNTHYKVILASLVLLIITPFSVNAQLIQELESTLVLSVNPTYPAPNENITVSIESYSIELSNATVSWFVDGILEQQVIGGTVFTFVSGELGTSVDIDVVASVNNISLGTKQITIQPTDADILWQGNTLTHSLYKGRHIPSVGSSINVEAVPHFLTRAGYRLHTDELTYLWRIEGKALPQASGRGKNTITITQTKPLKSILAEVEISSEDEQLFTKKSISIPVQSTELIVYENNPLLGVLFNNVIGGLYSLTGQETKFIVYPFFMSGNDRNASTINYVWRLNGSPITLGEDKSSITVGHSGEQEGTAEIYVSTQNNEKIFQKSESSFTIKFGKNSSPGFSF
ncbi:hypothetical protein HQ403_00960 [Candidatus Kaiserbacteria bacterium]|nr:hypothetical protein [Candidatus Kaiserbacteria bacterium]